MNIIYVSPKIYQHEGSYNYYIDLYRQLKRVSNCHLHNRSADDMLEILDACPFTPDAIVFGLTWFKHGHYGVIRGLYSVGIPKICFVHKPGTDLNKKAQFCNVNLFDVILHSAPIDETKFNGKCVLFGYGADPDLFHESEKKFDIGFSGALHGSKFYGKDTFKTPDLREKIQNVLRKTDLNCFLNGSDSVKPRLSYKDYAGRLSESKVWLATTGPDGDVTPRFYDVWASRTLLLCNPVPSGYMDVFRDGVSCVYFSEDLRDFVPKLKHYLNNDGERQAIINTAYSRFITNHTWRERAKQLCSIIKSTRTTMRT